MKCLVLFTIIFSVCERIQTFLNFKIQNNPYPPQTLIGLNHVAKSNPIVIVNRQTLFIPNLMFQNNHKDSHFWIGNGTEPTSNGTLIPDENGSIANLRSYNQENIYLKLPNGTKVNENDYFGIWSKTRCKNYGFVHLKSIRNIPDQNYGNEGETKNGKVIMRLPKCCPVFSVISEIGCELSEDITAEFEPKFPIFKHNQTHLDNESLQLDLFHFEPYIYSMDCRSGKYALDTKTEDIAILLNGSVILRSYGFTGILSQGEYCLETIKNNSLIDIFICVPENNIETAMFHIYIILILLSTISFGAVFVIFYFILQYKDIFKKCFMAYAFCMCLTFLCLSLVQIVHIDGIGCLILGYIFQFFIISSFTWLTVLCYDILVIILHFDDNTRYGTRCNSYLIITIFLPLSSIILSLCNKTPDIPNTFFKPQFERNTCNINNENQRLFAFYVPIFTLLTISLIFLVIAKYNINKFNKTMKNNYFWISKQFTFKYMYKQCFFTWLISLICPLVEIITNKLDSFSGFCNAMIIIEALQGVLIFGISVKQHYNNHNKEMRLNENRNLELAHLNQRI